MVTRPISQFISPLILRYMHSYGTISNYFKRIIDSASVRLMDSKMIIEDSLDEVSSVLRGPKITKQLPNFDNEEKINEYLNIIKTEGFGEYFYQFTGELGRLMISLCGNQQQIELLQKWSMQGYKGVFLLTDQGGPSVHHWLSQISDNHDNQVVMNVDKIWAINAHHADYAIVNVKKGSLFYPLSFLIPPEQYSHLEKTPIGSSFLDSKLQLGNVVGTTKVSKTMQLSQGGLTGVNNFLTMARPRFVLGVMAHLQWLINEERLKSNTEVIQTIDTISEICHNLLKKQHFDFHSVNEVLALKFCCNEFLVHLVSSHIVHNSMDQRDLLGLSKMEGSSYRCLYEIYSRENRTA